ncbi:MAG: carbamoyl phosphate synthase small subunit [Candidatus Diapherotrites archaeon CG11_big_fil_rev_8_21_14_0_20_37_9]|nr:MAG: carbamoyl phosphate synthase small subunit [Candidatus Diapherotrites archaeon CG11_big_fil_rev_8_21_14_0_20_37_9]
MNAKLVLADGTTFSGKSFGYDASISGEVVFNTGMVGYTESLTDPSYFGQILCLTYPLVGNYGVPEKILSNGFIKNFESHKIQVKGLVVNDYSYNYSHHAAVKSLGDWLKEEKIPAITGIDVRALTKHLREKGAMLGKIIIDSKDLSFYDPNLENLVEGVSIHKPVRYGKGKKIVLVDCGVKNNILANFVSRGFEVIRVPWNYDFLGSELDFDGLFISNGPGDPAMCTSTIKNIRAALEKEIPIFGICLGNQLLALAAGAKTYKLKYGHRSQNQPVYIVGEKKCFITSQNHGFAVQESTLSKEWEAWMRNANDDTNEGIMHKTKPFFSVQFHPEANPGPVDTEFLFDEFKKVLK